MAGKPFSLTMKAVIVDGEGRTLLIRRSKANKNFTGKWEWPGGKVDPGEDFAVAAVREAKEETGLDVELTAVAGVAQFEMPKAFVAIGGCALGLVALGGAAIGGLAIGGGAVGLVAIGGGAAGYYAFGGGALGVHVLSGIRH